MVPGSYGAPSQQVRSPFPSRPATGWVQDSRLQRQPLEGDGDGSSKPLNPQGLKPSRLPLTQKMVAYTGLSVLLVLIALPVSDAAILLSNFNYVFWSGEVLPSVVIASLVGVLILYAFVVGGIGTQGMKNYNLHGLVTLASTFCTLLGIVLVISALVLHSEEQGIINSLRYSCEGSSPTRELRTSYLRLLNVRESAACKAKFSVEDCAGYAAAAPPKYSNYLKDLEEHYHCSGFCYATTAANASFLEVGGQRAASSSSEGSLPSAFLSKEDSEIKKEAAQSTRTASLPPALFSPGALKSTCDGAAARNLSYHTTSISGVWWYMALVLIGSSATLSFGEWMAYHKVT